MGTSYVNSNSDVLWAVKQANNIDLRISDLQLDRARRTVKNDVDDRTWPVPDDMDLS